MTRRAPRGFTLVEMLVVLVLVAIMASFSPFILDRVLPGVRFEAAARELADTLRQARGFAVRDNRARFVVVDLGARLAGMGGAQSRQTLPENTRIDLVVAAVEQINAETGRIRFFPDGTSTGGKVVFSSDRRRLAVVVDWFDGRVSLVDEPFS